LFSLLGSGLWLLLSTHVTAQSCVQGGLTLEIQDECSFGSILLAFTDFFSDEINRGPSCSNTRTAQAELLSLLNVPDRQAGEAKVSNFCQLAYTSYSSGIPFDLIHEQGDGFLQKFFNGRGSWNTQTATVYPLSKDTQGQGILHRELEEDAAHLRTFQEAYGEHGLVHWPSELPNFSSCQMNTAYCCWPRDRQANDGNGNCGLDYDVNCIDKDPADNTDLCYNEGQEATFVFPNDDHHSSDNNAEGAIHCHGFAWADDPNHSSAAFKANNLFYISMYDHLYQRGYVNNIPGAPMCACAEQMPVVSRSDCTEMDVQQKFEISFDGQNQWTARLLSMDIEFNSCLGFNMLGEEEDNDLWAHMNRLYMEDLVSAEKLQQLTTKIVGHHNCRTAEQRYMATQMNLVVGYKPIGDWIQVAGRESFAATTNQLGKFSFNQVLESSPTNILERICGTCYQSHQHVFYKRLTPVPDSLNLMHDLMYSKEQVSDQVHGVDFQIYGTYDDAVNGVNPFICPTEGYRYYEGFPGDCGPNGELKHQHAIFTPWEENQDVAYFLNATNPFVETEDTFIGKGAVSRKEPVGRTYEYNGKLYLASNSADLWGERDSVYFKHETRNGDVDIKTKIEAFDFESAWAKTGIMVRDSLDPNSKYYSVLATSMNGVLSQWREEIDENTRSNTDRWDDAQPFQPVWLRLLKQGTTFSSYLSYDGINWNSVGHPVNIDITGSIEAGVFLSSNHWNRDVFEVVFSNYESEDHRFPSAAPSITPAPSRVSSVPSIDIGPHVDHLQTVVSHSPNSDMYRVETAGHGIWGEEDSFNFINFQHSNDFTVTAFVESIDSENEWARGGVMIRQSLDTSSPNVFTQLILKHGIFMTERANVGSDTNDHGLRWDNGAQNSGWVRLQKQGDVYTGSQSLDGINWQQIETVEVSMGSSNLYVGIAFTSSSGWNSAVATFRHFEITS